MATKKEIKTIHEVFGDKCKTIELKPPKFDIPDSFDNVAVFIDVEFTDVNIKKAHIGPSKPVKCFGVIPQSKEWKEKYAKLPPHERPFNCSIGEYEEMQSEILVKGIKTSLLRSLDEICFNVHHAWGMPDDMASCLCPTDNIGEWLDVMCDRESLGWVGYFKTYDDAKRAISEKLNAKKSALAAKYNQIDSLKLQ